ncbi:MAG: hypothetical protein GX028_08650, partial [Clostridiaceae bacterium]|nr:hypothetical protein [Clostridiaceae bacterium]
MSMTKTRAFVIVLMMCFLMTNLLFGQTVSADPVSASSELYADGGSITNAGLDLSAEDAPTVPTRYVAGEGYIDWDPASSVLTMYNADVLINETAGPLQKALITLPENDVTIILEGENSIMRNYPEGVSSEAEYAELIQQGELVWASEGGEALEDVKEHSITIDGSGSLVVGSGDGELLIATDGTLLMKNGYLTASENCDASMILNIARFEQTGGRIYMNRGISVFEDISISGGYIIGAGKEFSALMTYGDISISGGVVDIAPANMACLLYVSGNFSHTGGQLRALIGRLDVTSFSINFSSYGDIAALENKSDGTRDLTAKTQIFMRLNPEKLIMNSYLISEGNSLTLPTDSRLTIEIMPGQELGDCLINEGTLINDGQIRIRLDFEDTRNNHDDIAAMAVEVAALVDLASTGQIVIGDIENDYLFSNRGEQIIKIADTVEINTSTFFDVDGMRFFQEGDDYVLELDNINLSGGLTLPSNTPIIIRSSGTALISSIVFDNVYACDLTFAGGGVITVNSSLSSPNNDDIISVIGGTRVHVNGGISIGASGGANGNLVVSGEGSRLVVDSENGSAFYGGQVIVSDGAELIVNAGSGRGVVANGGNVSITNGSKLTANCEYGVYIQNGSLVVDETSTLITNGTMAPFCIVDTTGDKSQSEVLSLPFIPEGTAITYVTGTMEGYGPLRNYWSLIPLGGTLAVSGENSEPVTLTGTVRGLVT